MAETYVPAGVYSGGIGSWSASRVRMTKYPNAFLDYASMVVPTDVTSLWTWCSYFALTNPIVSACISRKSAYSATETIVRHESEIVREKWSHFLTEDLKLKQFHILMNMFMYTYGTAAFSVFPPFRKYFQCTKCGKRYYGKACKYRLDAHKKKFLVDCGQCGWEYAKVYDLTLPSEKGFLLRIWQPKELIRIEHGFTGRSSYFLNLATWFKNQIRLGKKSAILDTPQEIVDSVLKGMSLKLDRVFVMTEPGAQFPVSNTQRRSWPYGKLMANMKNCYKLQMCEKYEEVQIVTQMLPFRGVAPVLTGQPGTDVIMSGASGEWTDMVRGEYKKFQADPGHFAVFPVPVQPLQTQTPPSPLMPQDEINLKLDVLFAGLGFPRSLVMQDSRWSAAMPSLRLLEGDGKLNQEDLTRATMFIISEVRRYLDWPEPDRVQMRPVVSADQIQKLGTEHQMVSAGTMSRKTFHEESMGIIHEDEEKQIDREQTRLAERQMETQRMQNQEQMRIQKEQMQQQAAMGGPPQPGQEAPPGQEGAPPPQPGQPGQEAPQGDPNAPPVDAQGGQPQQLGPGESGPMDQGQQAPMESGLPAPQQFPSSGLPQQRPDSLSGSHGTNEQILGQIPPGGGVPPGLLYQAARAMKMMAPLGRAMFLRQVAMKNTEFHQALMQEITPGDAQKPLPENLPPRRAKAVI